MNWEHIKIEIMKYEKPEYLEDAPVFENNYIKGRQNEIKKALNPQGFL